MQLPGPGTDCACVAREAGDGKWAGRRRSLELSAGRLHWQVRPWGTLGCGRRGCKARHLCGGTQVGDMQRTEVKRGAEKPEGDCNR